jgi:hypothetical protein
MPGLNALDQRFSRPPGRCRPAARALLAGLVTVAVGCSSAAEDAVGSGIDAGWDDDSTPHGTAGAGDDAGSEGSDEGAADDGPAGPDDTSGDEPPPPTGEDDGTYALCPATLPSGWVFCEDFETITDPRQVMLDYQDGGGAFRLVEGTGASGTRSMEAGYRPGIEGSGWMVVSFGDSPIATDGRPTHAPNDDLHEVYWRLRVKTEPGWPSLGPGQLTRTISFAGSDWSEAVVAHLRSAGPDVHLEAVPVTCVTGTHVSCAGYDDKASLESLGAMVGPTPIFSESMSGQWHCVEGRLVLNTPGAADGVLEFWIDDVLQASRSDLDLRGSWDDYGINALVIENLWPGGAPQALRRWIDDVVIATEPIGCTPSMPPSATGR